MLTKKEELKLAEFIDSLRDDVRKERIDADLSPRALLWLAEKLKETNDYCKENHVYKRPPLGILR